MKSLVISIPHINVANAIRNLINIFDKFSAIASCYLTGSYADSYAIDNLSDIDLTIFVNSNFSENDKTIFYSMIHRLNIEYKVIFDITLIKKNSKLVAQVNGNEVSFREGMISALLAGKLLWGTDIFINKRISKTQYLRATELMPFEFSNRVRGYSNEKYPLSYPNENDFYYGYVNAGANGEISTKLLISLITWIGTATLVKLTGEKVGNKHQCIDLLKVANPIKGDRLSYVFDLCRNKWRYSIPTSDDERMVLREICAETLILENGYRDDFFKNVKDTSFFC